jgi:hypothetical protein
MSDEPQQHDEPAIPADAVEDLAPEDAEQDVSGGAFDAFSKVVGAPTDVGLKYEPGGITDGT